MRSLKLPFFITALALSTLACNYVMRAFQSESEAPPYTEQIEVVPPAPDPTGTRAPAQQPPTPAPLDLSDAKPHPASDEADRPTLGGGHQILDTLHFRIHYTLSGDHAISGTDANSDGIPDYVQTVAEALEHTWQVEITQLGWAAPPPDGNAGGDARYDVYLENIFGDGTAGYADGGWEETFVGDNPNSPAVETRASHSYLSLDNDYAEVDEWGDDIPPLDLMRVTVAHEFNHAIQYGYDGEEPADWLWEATATWIEPLVYPEIKDAEYYLDAVFKSPDTCQLAEGGIDRVEDENHWYALWIMLQHLSERHGNDIIRLVWEYTADLDGYAALDAALADYGSTLDAEFVDFSVALLLRAFANGDDYPTVRLEGEASQGEFIPNDSVGQMAADYIALEARGLLQVTLAGERLTGLLVGVQSGQADIFAMPNNIVDVDASAYEGVYLIVINPTRASNEQKCRWDDYTVNITTGTAATAPTQTLPAPHFYRPRVEPLLDPDEYWDE